ncbi:MAG: hypothetical protein JXB20_06380 [Bacilli bacterium]|nr:hypothetical protein [Bacilli bacterium]
MKTFSLSTKFQKIASILIDVFFIAFNVMVIIGSETPIPLMIVFFFFTVVLCLLYTYVVFSSKIIVDEARDLIVYRIFKDTIYDLRSVYGVKLEEQVSGKLTKQIILLQNERGFTIAEINPYLTKQSLKIMPLIYEEIKRILTK